ncbi:MFS transporter [Deltaproteobacteria bacterium]|nr:MFS transporter [Deltaproteobacteria bacterium]
MSSFVSSSNMSMINVALPVIGRELAMDAVLLGWVVTSHLLATAAFQVPLGKFADVFGRKKIYLTGTIVFTATTLLGGLANSATVLILSRGLAGVGGAMIITTGLAILTSVFTPEERGQAIAASMAAIYLGISLGPLLGGVLTEYLGWRSIFYVSSAIGLASVILAFWKLKGEWADARGEGFDYRGSIVFALGISAAMYGFSELLSLPGIVIFAAGMMGMIFFVRLEGRVKSPVLDIRIFRSNLVFLLSNLAVLINYCGAYASTFLMSLYLQYILGYPPQTTGIVLVVQPALMTLFALISGKLADTFTPRYVATTGLALNCAGLVMLAFLGEGSAIWYVIVSLGVFGVGGGLFSSPNANMTMSSVDNRLLGVASGAIATMRSAGMILSMGITMILFSLYIGNAEVTPEYYQDFLTSMRVAYIIFAALCFGGIFVQLSAHKARE